MALNFGSLGGIVGHEITHGFDDKGRQFDGFGNLNQWWEPETLLAFKNKAQCLISQYGNITVPEAGMKLNGINTQGENIADNAAITIVYKALLSHLKKVGGNDAMYSGIIYTPEQLLFIGFAKIFCGKAHTANLVNQIVSDPHTIPKYRIDVPAGNLPEYAEAFKCPVGSPMNPVHKCKVW